MKLFILAVAMIYLTLRYILFIKITRTKKIALFTILFISIFVEMFFSARVTKFLNKTYPFYLEIFYFLATIFSNLFLITLLLDAVFFIAGLLIRKHKILSRETFKKIGIFCISIALLSAPNLYYQGYKIPAIKTITFKSNKIKESKKIVILSDFHINRETSIKRIKKIVEKTNNLGADMVVLLGDVVDDAHENIREQIKALADLKPAGHVYFISGNHEFYYGYFEAVNLLENAGFKNIERRGINLDEEIFIGGVPDAICHTKRYRDIGACGSLEEDATMALRQSKSEQYKILLSHTPKNFDSEAFDLLLSGHMHGGQVPYFQLKMRLEGKRIAGIYKHGNKTIYISRGIGQWGPQIRMLTPSEITEVILKGED